MLACFFLTNVIPLLEPNHHRDRAHTSVHRHCKGKKKDTFRLAPSCKLLVPDNLVTQWLTSLHQEEANMSVETSEKQKFPHNPSHRRNTSYQVSSHLRTYASTTRAITITLTVRKKEANLFSAEANAAHRINKLRFILHQIIIAVDGFPTLQMSATFISHQMKH